ncbi:MAG: UDP-N-acetylmuramate dehydrogenase [Planctomycetota bacterium]
MPWPDSLFEGQPYKRAHPLAAELTVGTGGPAACFVEPVDAVRFAGFLRRLRRERIPHRILGGGANVLVVDAGIEEIVVSTRRVKHLIWEREGRLRVGAGVSLPWLVNLCRDRGTSGLEPLAGIPGSVGGAVRMNAGGRFGWIGPRVRELTVITPEGEVTALAPDESFFEYREAHLRGAVVLDAVLELARGDGDRIKQQMREVLAYKSQTQPLSAKSSGCFFRNSAAGPAGKLIDQAGLKGRREGGAVISPKHANFIVNEGAAKARDILALASLARQRVQALFGVDLVAEVDVWGEWLEAGVS